MIERIRGKVGDNLFWMRVARDGILEFSKVDGSGTELRPNKSNGRQRVRPRHPCHGPADRCRGSGGQLLPPLCLDKVLSARMRPEFEGNIKRPCLGVGRRNRWRK